LQLITPVVNIFVVLYYLHKATKLYPDVRIKEITGYYKFYRIFNKRKLDILFDLDDTLYDWSGEIIKLGGPNPRAITNDDKLSNKALRQVEGDQGFYARLELFPGAKDLINDLSVHFNIYFVSAPSFNNITSASDKLYRLRKDFPGLERNFFLTFNKDRVNGDVLIDDRTAFGAGKFPGIFIQYGTKNAQTYDEIKQRLYLLAGIKIDKISFV